MPITKPRRGTLDVSRDAAGRTFRLNRSVLPAWLLLFALCAVFLWLVHEIAEVHSTANMVFLPMLFPVIGAGFFALLFPLLVFIVYNEDFGLILSCRVTLYIFAGKHTKL
uniref:Uncharacterized protein n=1 Tax=Tetraselmis sp. GSL018 TaxID=582737 RepID=A0A061RQA6_9CHLO